MLVLPQSLNLVGFYMFILNKLGCSYTHSYYNRHFNVTPLAVSHDPRKEATKPKIKEADIACLFKVQVTCGGFDTLFLWFWWWVVAWPYTNRWLVINVIYIYMCCYWLDNNMLSYLFVTLWWHLFQERAAIWSECVDVLQRTFLQTHVLSKPYAVLWLWTWSGTFVYMV